MWDVLNWLAAGLREAEIPDDYPELVHEDFEQSTSMQRKLASALPCETAYR